MFFYGINIQTGTKSGVEEAVRQWVDRNCEALKYAQFVDGIPTRAPINAAVGISVSDTSDLVDGDFNLILRIGSKSIPEAVNIFVEWLWKTKPTELIITGSTAEVSEDAFDLSTQLLDSVLERCKQKLDECRVYSRLQAKIDQNLLDIGAIERNWSEDALVVAAGNWDYPLVKDLLEQNHDVNYRDERGRTALMAAVEEGNEHIVQLLLINGADPNITDDDGDYPLDVARYQKDTEIIQLLVDRASLSKEGPSAKELRDDEIYASFELANIVKRGFPGR